jgi:nicotinamide-nucleotide amidase
MSLSASPAPTGGIATEIVTTGTEILLGEIVDTNAAWIAQQLRESGINLYYKTTVGDNEARVRTVLELGLSRSDVILVTGGLGPTKDDITRQAIAAATDRELVLHEGALATLKERFARFGSQMTENNLQQVYIPRDAILVENPVGTAPGFIVEGEHGTVIAMPGVPREMKVLMDQTILPYLRERNGNVGVIRRRILRIIGMGESTIDHELSDLMQLSNPTVGLAAHLGQVDVRLTARATTLHDVEQLLDELEADVRSRIGRHVYSTTPDEPFVNVVADLLNQQGATVALLESNTDGDVARRLRDAGAATQLRAAQTLADADAPAVDEATAIALAQKLRSDADVDVALAIVSTGGADQGVYGKQAGETWLARATADGVHTARIAYGGREETTVLRVGNSALILLWRALTQASEAHA